MENNLHRFTFFLAWQSLFWPSDKLQMAQYDKLYPNSFVKYAAPFSIKVPFKSQPFWKFELGIKGF